MMNETKELITYILSQYKDNKIEEETALTIMEKISGQKQRKSAQAIAIVGMDCRLPDADNVAEYWQNLIAGKNSIALFPENRRKDIEPFVSDDAELNPEDLYARGGFLREIDKFDSEFFRISPREAVLMDPCHRLVLESAYSALENGNVLGAECPDQSVGVYVGLDSTDILQYAQMIEAVGLTDILSITGSLTSLLAGRISYTLGLNGPALVIDTSCSSGLVAVVEACKALNNGDCSVALAGGCNIMVTPLKENSILEIESMNSEVRAFDHKAGGTVFSEGVCFVVLKRLDDAIRNKDKIYGVIRSSAVNSDGASTGLTAPNPDAQVKLYQKAWEDAGIHPETISYIEAHGTGTIIGDAVELESLMAAFRKYTDKTEFCGIGSVKSNIGHTKGASGIASLIKVVLALQNRMIPATINFETPNPKTRWDGSPIYIHNRLKEWDSAHPLRAGVSSFGFSGTNAHLVVEEFRQPPETITNAEDPMLFTLSAKNEQSLQSLAKSYIAFLDDYPEGSLDNICYTANVCRPHLACRSIMLVSSIADLREKLAKIADKPATLEELNIYYNVCPEKPKKHQRLTGFTESNQAAESLNTGIADKSALYEAICKQYIQGDDIPWRQLYPDKLQKVHLPGYAFEKKRVWIDAGNDIKKKAKKDRLYPLVDEMLINTHEQALYKTRLSVSDYWPLAEHKIYERYVLPGTTLIDMATFVGVSQFGKNNFYLADLVFLQTITLDENDSLDLYIIVNKSEESMAFQMISKQDAESPDYVLHMQGTLVKHVQDVAASKSLENFREPPVHPIRNQSLPAYRIDNTKTDGDLILGPRWQVNGTVYQGKDELLADIAIPPEFRDEVQAYHLHPSLMDIAMNYVVGVLGNDIYVPFSIKELHIYGEMSSPISSYVTKIDRDGGSDEFIYVDVALLNEKGEVFAFLHRYAIKKLRTENVDVQDGGFFKKFFYRTRWISADLPAVAEREPIADNILFIRRNDAYSADLVKVCKDSGANVAEAVIGDDSASLSGDHPFMLNGSAADYNRLITHIKVSGISKIVHMSTLTPDGGPTWSKEAKQFKDELDRGLVSLCRLVQGLVQAGIERQTEIVLVTNNASSVTGEEKFICPLNGAYQAVAGVIARENSGILCRSIDIDPSVQVKQVISLIFGGQHHLRLAVRGNNVFVPEITNSFDNPHGNDKAVSLKHDGIYLVTGGMGGIGKEILKHLAKHTESTLIIIGRTAFDELESAVKTNRHIALINQLRSEGNRVEYFSVDVADYKAMERCFASIKDKYGKLDGIFHCAGVPGEKFLSNKSMDAFMETISPKVWGTYNIDRLTRGWEPDFVLLFSSLATILLPPGQTDYVAANAFLNAYAEEAFLAGRNVKNILWSAWEDIGMAFRANGNKNEGLNYGFVKAISVENGLKAMNKVLNSNIQNAVVCELDFSFAYDNQLDEFGYSLDRNVQDQFKRVQAVEVAEAEKTTVFSLTGKDVFTPTELLVGEIWGRVLGFAELDVTADFHQLGGDSIHSIQIINEINKVLNAKLDVIHIFDYPTIEELSGYLDSTSDQSRIDQGEETNAPIVREYNMSEVQLRIWFIQKLLPQITIYHLPMILKLDFPVELSVIEETINTIIKRHSVFRTIFVEKDHGVRQIILDDHHLNLELVDYTHRGRHLETVEQEIYAENNQPFDFSHPLIKAKVYKVREALYYLYINIHHLICDGWSSSLLMDELMNTYQDISSGKVVDSSECVPRYVDWVAEMEEWKEKAEYLVQKKYWENELSGALPVIDLPLDYDRPENFTYNGDTHTFFLAQEVKRKIKHLSASLNYSGHILMQSLFFLFLHRITGDEDMIIGIPAAGRDNADYEKVIGVFMNVLCIRLKWNGLNSLEDLLEEVKNKNHRALRNGRMPFADLIGFINPDREMSRNPIFSVFFQYYDNIPPINEGTSQFDLSLYCKDEADGIYCRFEYNTDLFRKETVQKFGSMFAGIVNIVTDLIMANEAGKNAEHKAAISLTETFLLLEQEIADESLKRRIREKYWTKMLDVEWPDIHLPYDRQLPALRAYDWNTLNLEIDESLMLQVNKICSQMNIPLSQFILAVYSIVLSQYGQEEELMVGTVFHDFSAAILPLRMIMGTSAGFSEILREIGLLLSNARLHGDYPVEKMMEIAARKHGRQSLFNAIFVYAEDRMEGAKTNPALQGYPCPGNPDIVLVCENTGNKLLLQISYCSELFEDITIQRLSGHILLGLKAFALNTDLNPASSAFTTAEEIAWIADVINHTETAYNKDQTIIDRFREQVSKHADKTALVFAGNKMTYRELNEQANKLAHYLVERGIGPDSIVGIKLERSLEMVIAILGVLKSGGAYLPIDVDAPKDRIDYILDHARADILLVSKATESGNNGLYTEIRIDSPEIAETSSADIPLKIQPSNLAYVIYTSGSTGKPKGVMVSHGNVHNFLNWAVRHFSFDETDKMMLVTAISFDISVMEIFGALLAGAELHIIRRELLFDPASFGDYCRNQRITVWHSVPSLMIQYLTDFDGERKEAFEIESLRHVMLGGEAWSKDLARRVRKVFEHAQITNVYGPTEATIWVTSHIVDEQELDDASVLPAGKPIDNNKVYILDDAGNLCGIGIPGEIYIHGDNVTRGYLNNEAKTSESFSLHPQYGYLYRTGDLGKYAAGGAIHYLGRKDNQVKVRGYRIELGEIENVLAESEEIRQCAVVAVKDGEVNKLVCYYEAKEELTIETMRERLAAKLPDYMLPSQFVSLANLPLTPNGKIDRKALMAYEVTGRISMEQEYVEPVTDNEKILAKVWSAVLNVEKIGLKDDFFAMGGNSIKLVQVLIMLREHRLEANIMDCFKYKTIEELGAHLTQLNEIEDHSPALQNAVDSQDETYQNYETAVVLTDIEPFNSIFYKECFYNAYFPVVRHFKGNMDLILANDVVLYKTDELGLIDLDVEFISVKQFMEIHQMAGLSMTASNCTSRVGDRIIHSLSEGRPVIIPVDCYFETIRPDMFNKNHWPHTLLVYGYDLNKRVFKVIEHDDINSLTYQKCEIDFNVLEDCHNGFNKYFGVSGEDNYYEFFAYEEGRIGTDSLAREMYIENLLSFKSLIYERLINLKHFKASFSEFSKDEISVKSMNIDKLPYSINNIINSKKSEIYKFNRFFDGDVHLTSQLEVLIAEWLKIRLFLEKYKITMQYNKRSFDKINQILEEIIVLEYNYYDSLYKYIDTIKTKQKKEVLYE